MTELNSLLHVNDTQVFYSIKGEGDPIVCLHGSFADHHIWDYQVDALTGRYKVIRFDQRGYGKSAVPSGKFSFFEDLKGLIDTLGLKKVSLMGSSFGGSVAIDFTLKYPSLVKSLILAASGLNGHLYSVRFQFEAMKLFLLIRRFKGTDAVIERYLNQPFWSYFYPSPTKVEARAKVIQAVKDSKKFLSWHPLLPVPLKPFASKRLKEIGVPTLIIHGDKDGDFILKIGEYIHKGIENSKKIIIPGCSHLPQLEEPNEFNRIVLDFLRENNI